MKKLCILAFLLMFAFVACGNNQEPTPPPAQEIETPATPEVPPVDEVPADEEPADEEPGEDYEPGEEYEPADYEPLDEEPADEEPSDEDPSDEEPADEEPVPAPQALELPPGVVYSLSTDGYFQAMEVGTSGSDERVLTTEYLMGAGTPTFSVIENPLGTGNALRLTNRDQTWHAVDIVTSAMNLDTSANSYLLTIRGSISQAGNVNVGGGDSPYATLFSQAAQIGEFTLTGTVTASTIANAGERGHFRVSVNNLRDLEIHEITLERIDLVVPFAVPERAANVVYSLRTDAYIQGRTPGDSGLGAAILGGSQYLTDAGNPIFTVVSHPSGDASRALRVSNRAEDWHTLDINVAAMGLNLAGGNYTIRASGRIENPPAGSTADFMGTGDPWGRFGAVEVGADGAFTVEGVINAASMAENGSTDRVRLAASNEAGEAVFYVYELEVIRN